MLSIIVCSVKEAELHKLKENITATIGEGVEYEIISHDNTKTQLPIAAVYNQCASRAQYPYLLFIHEDAGFISEGWYGKIASKLSEADCGVIGFAGTRVMYDVPGSWFVDPLFIAVYMNQNGAVQSVNIPSENPWVKAVAVDGYAMFVRRDVWQTNRFDEELLTGFHCYDIDFSLAVARNYTNYICGEVLTYHNSTGNYNMAWIEETMKLYGCKWKAFLPVLSDEIAMGPRELADKTERAYFRIIKRVAERNRLPRKLLQGYRELPMTLRKLEHWVKILGFRLRGSLRENDPAFNKFW